MRAFIVCHWDKILGSIKCLLKVTLNMNDYMLVTEILIFSLYVGFIISFGTFQENKLNCQFSPRYLHVKRY